MLLRSITKHVRDQNWFAVGLDFCIVVFGVFVGVQMGNWNQSLQQRQIYEEAFDRVIVELQINLKNLEAERNAIGVRLPIVQLALEDLRTCQIGAEAQSHVEAAFPYLGTMPSFRIDTKALDQLINNDSFLPFQTPRTRKRFMGLSTQLNLLSQGSEEIGDQLIIGAKDISHILTPGPLTIGGPDQIIAAIKKGAITSPELVRNRQLIVSLAQACKDEAFLSVFYAWEDIAYFHSIMGGFTRESLRSDLEVLKRLADDKTETTP